MDFSEETLKKLLSRSSALVNFAGLGGDTASMVKHGWELNVSKNQSQLRDSLSIRIAGVHRAMNLQFLSAPFELDYDFIFKNRGEFLSQIIRAPWEIKVEAFARNIIVRDVDSAKIVSYDWSGYLDIHRNPSKMTSVADFFHFPERGSEIYIPEDKIWTVEEHLDSIRRMQEPLQDEILRNKLALPSHKQLLKLVAV